MQRQQITDRNDFDYEDKRELLQKSNGRCAHCGKQIFAGFNATVDHFIPLSKGGINQRINIVMLCKECNKEKTNKILAPKTYLKYLKPKYLKEIENYFESYIKSFDYISRGNLLQCDEYTIRIVPDLNFNFRNKRHQARLENKITRNFTFKRAYPDDLNRLKIFFIEYLRKINELAGESIAKKNIEFWHKFGAIYYIEDENKDIEIMAPMTIVRDSEDSFYLKSYIFSKHADKTVRQIVNILPQQIARKICEEQDMPWIRTVNVMLINDKASKYLNGGEYFPEDKSSVIAHSIYHIVPKNEIDKDDANIKRFYEKFKNIEPTVRKYLERPENQEIKYMISEIIDE